MTTEAALRALKAAQRGLTAYKYGHDLLLPPDVSDLRESEANEIGTEALETVNAAIEAALAQPAGELRCDVAQMACQRTKHDDCFTHRLPQGSVGKFPAAAAEGKQ